MQMKPREFWFEYTFADFQRKAYYFFKNKNEEFKDRWNQIRKLAHINALVAGAKVEADEVLPLPWDEENESVKEKPMTASEGASIIDRYSKMGLFNKHKLN